MNCNCDISEEEDGIIDPGKLLIFIFGLILLLGAAAGLAHCQQSGSSEYGDQFPDAPEPVKTDAQGNLTHDKSGDPPRWYQHTFTKKFVAAETVSLFSNAFDAEMTHEGIAHHRCVEGNLDLPHHPSRGELYQNALIPWAAMTGLDIATQTFHLEGKERRIFGWIPYTGSFFNSEVHIRGGFSWLQNGCW